MSDEITQFILQELYKKYSIPILIVNKKLKQIISPCSLEYSERDLNLNYLNYCQPSKVTILLENNTHLFSLFKLLNSSSIDYDVLIGPYPYTTLDKSLGQNQNNFSINNSNEEFINFTKLIYSILNKKIISDLEITYSFYNSHDYSLNNSLTDNLKIRSKLDPELDSIELEKRLISSIIQNDIKTFEWIFNQMHKTYFARIHSDRLMSLKYKYVGLITILTRVSINNGVKSSKAYALSDSLIQKLEFIKSLQECVVYLKESSLLFMSLINSNIYSETSPLISDINNYIDLHINEKITLEQLSKYCHKHKSYLSAEFKKQTGQTIHNYINYKKVKEAKHILLFTNLKSTEIASSLGFSDQSHFILIFKQFENMTPNEYRKKYQSTKIL